MTNKKLNLTNVQKRILSQMQEYGYLLVHNRFHLFFVFQRGEKILSSYVSNVTAHSLIKKDGILEVEKETEEFTYYKLTEEGRKIDLS